MKTQSLKCLGTLMMATCLTLLMFSAGLAENRGPQGHGSHRPAAPTELGTVLQTVRVTIEKKCMEYVTTNSGDKYHLYDSTIIVDTDGQQVSTREMLVPCDVEIGYLTQDGKNMAERITIQRVGANATPRLNADRPE